MEDQKVEWPILRRDSGGSNEWPKSGIAYTTARLWWPRWTTKKWNCLYYGEILVVEKIEFPILRRDLGFPNEGVKNGITYATARSWGGPKSPKSLTIDGNIEKSMNNYEKGWNIDATHWKWWKTAGNRWNLMKMMKLNDQLSQDFRSHASKTQKPPTPFRIWYLLEMFIFFSTWESPSDVVSWNQAPGPCVWRLDDLMPQA